MSENNLCINCHKRSIYNKKRQLCFNCYQNLRNKLIKKMGKTLLNKPLRTLAPLTIKKRENAGEIEFIKNFFKHTNWKYGSATFKLNGNSYTPDFYDGDRNTFIEVSSTRQAYHANKPKYALFRKLFPNLKFEIRKPTGNLLNEESRNKEW